MRVIHTLFLLILSSTFLKAQNVIAVHGPSGTHFYKDLDSAINNAVNGDTLNLPGGGFTSNSNFIQLNKELHFIGTGVNLDSSQVTNISLLPFYISFNSGSDNSSIEGCYINGYIDIKKSISNLIISRCIITKGIKIDSFSHDILIKENLITGGWNFSGNINCQQSLFVLGYDNLICNNKFDANCIANNSNLKNNYFASGTNAAYGCYSLSGTNNIVESNIGAYLNSLTNCILKNNINIGITSGVDANNNQNFNNYYEASVPSIFINSAPTGINVADYQLVSSSVYLTLGTNGTQIGLFGGAYPMKMGQIPSNPHVTNAVVAPQTNNNGELHIDIKVRAEQQ